MKSCLADLYRKVSAQIRKELRVKEAESRLRLYRHYIPFIIEAISESIDIDAKRLYELFNKLAEKHVRGHGSLQDETYKEDKITKDRIQQEIGKNIKMSSKLSTNILGMKTLSDEDRYLRSSPSDVHTKENEIIPRRNEFKHTGKVKNNNKNKIKSKKEIGTHTQITLDKFDKTKQAKTSRRK